MRLTKYTLAQAHASEAENTSMKGREKNEGVTNQEQQTAADNEAFSSDGCRECLLQPLTWQKN